MKTRLSALFCALLLSAFLLQGCPSNNNPAAPAPVTVVELVTATFTGTPTASPTVTPGGPATATPVPPPSVINGYFSTDENTALILSNSDLNTLTSDPNGDPLIFLFPGPPSDGTVSLTHISHTNTVTYTPNNGFYGTDIFPFYVHDQATNEDSPVHSMVVTVVSLVTSTPTQTATSTPTSTPTATPTATPIPPPAVSDSGFSDAANTTLNVPSSSMTALITSDPNGDPLTFSLVGTTSYGTLTLNSDGSFTYTPGTFFTGTDSFTFQVYDTITGKYSSTATITITVS